MTLREPSGPFASIHDLLEHQARHIPDSPAILAPARAPLTYGRLHHHVDEVRRALRGTGIGPRDRVAVVLPNGPEMAVATLAVAASAACAPMNPAYGAEELDRYFRYLRPRGLIAQAGIDSPASRVADAQGLPVVRLSIVPDAEAGLFTLAADPVVASLHEETGPGGVALLLLTSGTTSRPKIVPLTHANVCASAYWSGAALALGATDRCLNVLPLFHGHGLIATVLASLAAGASVVCAPGCDVDRFVGWLTAFQPTWYSAVPAIHQAIVARARHDRARVADSRLRFIRSASAPLPPRTFADLERTFAAPVIEFYGMTETASSPIACNPLPPRQRKPGSVGVRVGLDVAIIDEAGAFLPDGRTGQVVVRGASVAPGYDADPIATSDAFAGDWFRTGDLGVFDDDGYLFLVGRIREIINRGGEKVAPREVDEVLLEHPAVARAVTFAVPHPTLGEDVAAAVVLHPGAATTPSEIRRFTRGRLADFKAPRRVLIVTKLPEGPTGKVQRIGLAAKLELATGVSSPSSVVAPRTSLEKALAELWRELLHVGEVGVHDDFFALGGDSLLAAHLLTRLNETFHVEVEVSRFFEAPTVADLAHHLETLMRSGHASRPFADIAPVPPNEALPASVAQERLWTLQQLLPGLPFFNIVYALRVRSTLDRAVLEHSLNEIVRRHEILRTTFAVVDGRPVQVVAPRLTVPLAFDDLGGLPESEKERAGHRLIQDDALHAFDLGEGPLLRTRLVRVGEREYILLLTLHQVVADGWSLGVLTEELTALYDAFSARNASPLPPLPIQFADFARWQRHWRQHRDVAAQLDYWRKQLRDPLCVLALATAPPGRPVDALLTARRRIALPVSLSEAVKRFSHREQGTVFMALVAALGALLHRSLDQEDLRIATVVANRHRPGTKRLIGPLVNTVILRIDLGGDPSPRELMRRVRTTTLSAYAHQDLPFEEVVGALERERGLKPPVLSQVMLALRNATLRPVATSGRTVSFEEANPEMPLPLVTTTSFAIVLMLFESDDGLVGSCLYKPHLFSSTAIDRLVAEFQRVLEHMVTQPDRPISALRNAPHRSRRDLPWGD